MDFRSVIEANRESYMDELFEVLRQKSISAQNDIRECAELMMEKLGQMSPSRSSADLPFIEPIRKAAEASFHKEAFIQPSMGGSLPDAVWTKVLGTPSVVPYANVDEANHSPNENLVVEHFYSGIETTCRVIAEMKHITL
ncbi:hypothetical protein [Salinicoccus roseus]|uniref:hypothetical protein n=1 Tax=Salinicoccus roseus TaxID=45670 RepID=UPI003566F539